ncbi:hypothetical protein ACFRKD_32275 [Streptomyces niveus]|uniref:hypothetical protein n=1 Tax=Streptomyces niveus TaxID=193462 RepID=UPI0036B83973
MIMRHLFLYGVLPGFLAVLLLHVHTKSRPAAAMKEKGQAEPSFVAHYLKSCAGFPLICLFLISLVAAFPGRIP